MKIFIKTAVISLFLLFLSVGSANAASQALAGWAWSDTIGWIQFDPTYGGVFIDDETGDFSGYAWSDNIGWIDFSGVSMDGAGVVTGLADAIAADGNGWDGQISMNCSDPGVCATSNYSVNMDPVTGDFSGYAWGSDVVGWVSFNGSISPPVDPPGCPGCVGESYECNDGIDNDVPPDGFCDTEGATCTDDSTPGDPGCDSPTDNDETDIPTSVPNDPSGLSATAGTGAACQTIDLSWTDNSDNETRFEIERGYTGDPFSWLTDVGVNVISYQDTGLTGGAGYWYRVRACNTAGCSGYSNISWATAEVCTGGSPEFTISNSNAIFATTVESQQTVSTETIITITNPINFSDPVLLSVQSITPAMPGATYNFNGVTCDIGVGCDTLTSSEYSTGSTFSVNVPGDVNDGLYEIIIYGTDGINRTNTLDPIQLNIENLAPGWTEF